MLYIRELCLRNNELIHLFVIFIIFSITDSRRTEQWSISQRSRRLTAMTAKSARLNTFTPILYGSTVIYDNDDDKTNRSRTNTIDHASPIRQKYSKSEEQKEQSIESLTPSISSAIYAKALNGKKAICRRQRVRVSRSSEAKSAAKGRKQINKYKQSNSICTYQSFLICLDNLFLLT